MIMIVESVVNRGEVDVGFEESTVVRAVDWSFAPSACCVRLAATSLSLWCPQKMFKRAEDEKQNL